MCPLTLAVACTLVLVPGLARADGAAKVVRSTAPATATATAPDELRQRAREALRREMMSAGFAELAAAATQAATRAPPVSWDRPAPASAATWGTDIHDVASPGGLTLASKGEGSDVRGPWLTIARVGTLGQGDGVALEERPLEEHALFAKARGGVPRARARKDPDAILRVIRANFGAFHVCYGLGLRKDRALRGRVTVKVDIDPNGTVLDAADAGSDLPDPAVVSCVVTSFMNLGFAPTGAGRVTVVYPLVLHPPGEGDAPSDAPAD